MSTANDKAKSTDVPEDAHKVSNFLRQIIESGLARQVTLPTMLQAIPIPPKFALASRQSPTVTCMWVMPKVFV
jgi:hypothetical protein